MNKLLIALTATFLAATAILGSAAQAAGFNVRIASPGASLVEKAGCGSGYSRVFKRKTYHRSVRRSVPRKVIAKRVSKPETVAKVEKPAIKEETKKTAALSENSSIATGTEKVAAASTSEKAKAGEKQVAAVKDVGCKQFFPSVGMTLSVTCD